MGTAGDVNGDGFDDVIVGAYYYSDFRYAVGAAFVYHGSASGLSASPAWDAYGSHDAALFGSSVGTAGDVNGDGFDDVIVGAKYWSDDEPGDSHGAAYVYHGSASGLSSGAAWAAHGSQDYAFFGTSVGTAGDVNGDAFDDVVVGAPGMRIVLVYHGSTAGLPLTSNWTGESDQVGAEFGFSVGTAGDVNGDGFDDVIVGAWFYDNGQINEGRAFVYHGSDSGLSTTPSWTAESDQQSAYFGNSVGTAGDVNGDGFDDVIVGAPFYSNDQGGEGRAFVYHGSASGLSFTPAWMAESDQASALFGTSVGTAGDVNGDGFDDVIVGAITYNNGQLDEGRAFVYQGSDSGLSTTPSWTAESDQRCAFFGYSVGTAGDVNGDGFDDVIVGALLYDHGQSDEGRAFVYHGSASGLSFTPAWMAESNQASANFGESVGTAGDVNGDGIDDVIVGAPLYDDGQEDEGRAFVYRGSASGLRRQPRRTAEGRQESAWFGWSVSTAGDVNGDGFDDVIVGARGYDNGQIDEGRAFAWYGG